MIKGKYAFCPHCNVELNNFDHYDCYDDDDITVYYTTGSCPKCERDYRWEEIYKYSHFENFEEVE